MSSLIYALLSMTNMYLLRWEPTPYFVDFHVSIYFHVSIWNPLLKLELTFGFCAKIHKKVFQEVKRWLLKDSSLIIWFHAPPRRGPQAFICLYLSMESVKTRCSIPAMEKVAPNWIGRRVGVKGHHRNAFSGSPAPILVSYNLILVYYKIEGELTRQHTLKAWLGRKPSLQKRGSRKWVEWLLYLDTKVHQYPSASAVFGC